MKGPNRRTAAALGAAASLVTGLGMSSVASAAPAATTDLAGSRPSFATSGTDTGAVPASTPVDFEIALNLPKEAAAEQEVQALSTPGSPSFRKFLTADQFRAAYAPSAAATAAVSSWAEKSGLSVVSVAPSRLYVEVAGTAAQAENLTGTSLHHYQSGGKVLTGPTSDYKVPASLASTVAGFVNLDDSDTAQPAASLPGPPPGVRYGVQPCSAYYGEKIATDKPSAYGQKWPYTICGYHATQYQKAFGLYEGIRNGVDGRGVTVAITDAYASPTMLADANQWSRQNGLPTFAPGQYTQITPNADAYSREHACGPQGWYGEESLDVEAVHAMAPGANILYYGGANCAGGLNKAWASAIDQGKASVVTDSWTFGNENVSPAAQTFFQNYLLEAATTGITVQFSSGDSGDGTSGGTKPSAKTVEFPASNPYATGVGGTSTEIGVNGQIVFQHGWSSDYSQLSADGTSWTPTPPGTYSSGAGGGTSVLYKQPFYQKGVVPASISKYYGSTPMRAVPDVAMPADPNTGLRIGETQVFKDGTYYSTYRLGGTSLSSPLFAGVMADAIQYNGSAVGLVNPLLYRNVDTSAITDVLPPSSPTATVRTNLVNGVNNANGYSYVLQTIDVQTTTIHTLPGYDDETGTGTPNGAAFLQAMKY
ncbi:S53 family peptidase [Acidiferrimicrobium sp. IK]|uniref:S53 family peptidase n=1 Tax=Acidiferrimicrobium sp. IK TaxID=2871700 RepID=UPI0021CAFF13|nr:S53 family peptidase [Acidiferrimicrobium sp. IK]MCU4187033.1 S53 family peptidase [Acidiferrimicrobium sp. IK]